MYVISAGFIAFHVWRVPPDRRPVDTYMQILSVVMLCPYVESCFERKNTYSNSRTTWIDKRNCSRLLLQNIPDFQIVDKNMANKLALTMKERQK